MIAPIWWEDGRDQHNTLRGGIAVELIDEPDFDDR
jgi:hypothetical protein